ncbi:STAS domain-containing protein [Bacillus sp. ISL-40]|uniref:STAS domain-containing protein n=1 Tax=unclassified Bacillus (in: firmicutes) TaxID=185979 RepID=UPI001BEB4BFA|nr:MULTISPECIES: STAS domain-containing protein [unclassified Bacillus (in: firmicutes)]MBT2698998.1 STAS domain-containing protein [Bacillus sp. ISL-40]MBT2739499.1 STAS domain-containing protein [Bacillus sp. ISL-77]
MNTFYDTRNISAYIIENKEEFQNKLLSEAVNVASNIEKILTAGNIDLLKNAQKLVLYVVENRTDDLITFANEEGVAWARYSLTLAFKLEWVHAIRRALWHFIKLYDQLNEKGNYIEDFFELEHKVNDGIDEFLNTFFISYSQYKDELILSQRKLVEHLSVPIIPVSSTVAVLPLIGTFDSYRMDIIEEKVLTDILRLRILTLIIDLSGISDMDEGTISDFQKVLIGVTLMGAKSVITGLRPELVRRMVNLGIDLHSYTETKATLQQTLNEHLVV